MALGTIDDIKASVADWLNRSDLTAQIDDFITMAIEEAYRKLNIPFIDQVYVHTITSTDQTNKYFDLPEKNMNVVSVTDSNGRSIEAVTFEDYRGHLNSSGRPLVYSSVGNNIYIGPNPSESEVFTLNLENAYSNASQLVQTMPEVLLMGALMFGCTYLKDDNRGQMFKAKFYEGIEDRNRRGTGGAGRSRITDHSISTNGGPLV